MTTPSKGTNQGETELRENVITAHLGQISQSPTDFLGFFRDVVSRAKGAGVSQQQLLDYVADNYGSTGSTK